MEALIFIVLVLVGVCAYVYLKNSKDNEPVQEVKPENVAPVATGSISLAPPPYPALTPPYPALTAKEAVAITIAKVAESKQETVVAETPIAIETPVVATVAEETPAPKVPAKRGPAPKSTTTKTKKKK